MTAETHGESQKAFDRIVEALQVLRQRVRKEGKTASSAPPARTRPERER